MLLIRWISCDNICIQDVPCWQEDVTKQQTEVGTDSKVKRLCVFVMWILAKKADEWLSFNFGLSLFWAMESDKVESWHVGSK